jgi:hypothetical protein
MQIRHVIIAGFAGIAMLGSCTGTVSAASHRPAGKWVYICAKWSATTPPRCLAWIRIPDFTIPLPPVIQWKKAPSRPAIVPGVPPNLIDHTRMAAV